MAVFVPTYFSSIYQYQQYVAADEILFEVCENYQKQSFRNRCYIASANGKQLLTVPVKHSSKEGRKKTKDIKIEYDFDWQKQHLKALQISYRSSPFFEFLEQDLIELFDKKHTYLLDLNIATFLFVDEIVQFDKKITHTNQYVENPKNDFRYLADKKFETQKPFKIYTQIFDDKVGFLENLSILDLLFMEGRHSIDFIS